MNRRNTSPIKPFLWCDLMLAVGQRSNKRFSHKTQPDSESHCTEPQPSIPFAPLQLFNCTACSIALLVKLYYFLAATRAGSPGQSPLTCHRIVSPSSHSLIRAIAALIGQPFDAGADSNSRSFVDTTNRMCFGLNQPAVFPSFSENFVWGGTTEVVGMTFNKGKTS